jgi:2-hydroxychromene-2-carboxylate isomerase
VRRSSNLNGRRRTGLRPAGAHAEPSVKDRPLKNTEASVASGAFGSPTFFVSNVRFFGKDRLLSCVWWRQ